MLDDDRPLWLTLLCLGGVFVVAFNSPTIVNSNELVSFENIPFAWLALLVGVSFLGVLYTERVHEWSDFDIEEKKAFAFTALIGFAAVVLAWFGGFAVGALLGLSYEGLFFPTAVPIVGWLLYRYLTKPKHGGWD